MKRLLATSLLAICLLAASCTNGGVDAAEFGALQAETEQLAEQNAKLTERIETLTSAQSDTADLLADTTTDLAETTEQIGDMSTAMDNQTAENERLELCAATYADLAWSNATDLAAINGIWRFVMWGGTEFLDDKLAEITNPWTLDDYVDRHDLADSSYKNAYDLAVKHNCVHIDSGYYFWFPPA